MASSHCQILEFQKELSHQQAVETMMEVMVIVMVAAMELGLAHNNPVNSRLSRLETPSGLRRLDTLHTYSLGSHHKNHI